MIERGHYHELQSIIDMLPVTSGPGTESSNSQSELNVQRKKRQTFVFSATIALSDNFRKKLKRGISTSGSISGGLSSIETLSERAGMRPDAAVVDLTNASIMANKLEECFIMYALFLNPSQIPNTRENLEMSNVDCVRPFFLFIIPRLQLQRMSKVSKWK